MRHGRHGLARVLVIGTIGFSLLAGSGSASLAAVTIPGTAPKSAPSQSPTPQVDVADSKAPREGSQEITSQRTQDSKLFRNADGTYTSVFGNHLHFKDDSHKWQNVDLRFRRSGTDFVADQNDVVVRVAGAGVNVVNRTTHKGVRWLTASAPSVSDRSAEYSDGGLTWTYVNTLTGIELTAKVQSARGPQTYSFKYALLGGASDFTVNANGDLVGDGFTVPRASAVGANGLVYQAGPWTVSGDQVAFAFDDSTFSSSAFPYVLDPSYTANNDGNNAVLERDSTGSEYPPSATTQLFTTGLPATGNFAVARSYVAATGKYQIQNSLLYFNTSSLPSDARIYSAGVTLHVLSQYNADLLSVTGDWYSSFPATTAAYASTSGTGALVSSPPVGQFFQGTNGATGVDSDVPLSTSLPNRSQVGVRLHVSGDSSQTSKPTGLNSVTFSGVTDATYAPRLSLTYASGTCSLSTPTVSSPSNGAIVNTLTPTLTLNSQGKCSYQFTVSSGSTTVAKSEWIPTVPQWKVPDGKLADGGKYSWTATAMSSTGALGTWASTGGNAASVARGVALTTYNGYLYELTASQYSSTSVQVAPINANGTLGTWSSSGGTIAGSSYGVSLAAYNGYLYELTASQYGSTSVQIAPIYSDGTLGTWSSSNGVVASAARGVSLAAYNGYLYELTASQYGSTSVQAAPIRSDGTLGSWTSTGGYVVSGASNGVSLAAYNGYLYELTASPCCSTSAQVATINADGTLGSWSSTGGNVASVSSGAALAAYNGYLYELTATTCCSTSAQVATINADGTLGSWASTGGTVASASYGVALVANDGSVYELTASNCCTTSVQRSSINSSFSAASTSSDVKLDAYRLGSRAYYPMQSFGLGGGTSASVNVATGNLVVDATDISVATIADSLTVSHTYNSGAANIDGPLGYGWTLGTNGSSEAQYSYLIDNTSQGNIDVKDVSGGDHFYYSSGSNTYTSKTGDGSTLTKNNTTWQWDLATRDLVHYLFDQSTTQLVQVNAPARAGSASLTYTYSGSQLTSIKDPLNRTLSFYYSGSHLITIQQNFDPSRPSTLARFSYSPNGDLAWATNALLQSTQFLYDSNHLMLTIATPKALAYNWPATNFHTGFTYYPTLSGEATPRISTVRRYYPPSNTDYRTTFAYSPLLHDPTKHFSVVTSPRGQTSQTQFGFKTIYQYNDQTNPIAITDPNGHTSTTTWNTENLQTSTTDPDGNTTTYKYDGNNNLCETDLPAGINNRAGSPAKTFTKYDEFAQAYTCDPSFKPTPAYNLVTTSLDAEGGVTKKLYVDPTNATAPKPWVSAEVAGTADGFGNVDVAKPWTASCYTYYSVASETYRFGQLATKTMPKGALGTTPTAPCTSTSASYTTTYNYWTSSDTYTFPDGTSQPAQAQEGWLKDTVQPSDPSGITCGSDSGAGACYHYDGSGHKIHTADAKGDHYYKYDALGREVAREDLGATGNPDPSLYTTTGYDADGNRVRVSDPSLTADMTSWAYDDLNRMISSTDAPGATTAYGYDQDNNLVSKATPAGTSTYVYDSADLLSSQSDPIGTTTFVYDNESRVREKDLPNNTHVDYAYNAAGWLTSLRNHKGGSDATDTGVIVDSVYTYDGNGKKITEARPGTGVPGSASVTGAISSSASTSLPNTDGGPVSSSLSWTPTTLTNSASGTVTNPTPSDSLFAPTQGQVNVPFSWNPAALTNSASGSVTTSTPSDSSFAPTPGAVSAPLTWNPTVLTNSASGSVTTSTPSDSSFAPTQGAVSAPLAWTPTTLTASAAKSVTNGSPSDTTFAPTAGQANVPFSWNAAQLTSSTSGSVTTSSPSDTQFAPTQGAISAPLTWTPTTLTNSGSGTVTAATPSDTSFAPTPGAISVPMSWSTAQLFAQGTSTALSSSNTTSDTTFTTAATGNINVSLDWTPATESSGSRIHGTGWVDAVSGAPYTIERIAAGNASFTVTWTPNLADTMFLDLKDATGCIVATSAPTSSGTNTVSYSVQSAAGTVAGCTGNHGGPGTYVATIHHTGTSGTNWTLDGTAMVSPYLYFQLIYVPTGAILDQTQYSNTKPQSLSYTIPSGATGQYKIRVIDGGDYRIDPVTGFTLNYDYPGYADLQMQLLKPDGSGVTGATVTSTGTHSSTLTYTVPAGATGDHSTGNYKLRVTEAGTYGTASVAYTLDSYTYQGYADTRISLLKPDGSDAGATVTPNSSSSSTLTYTVPSGATGNHTTGNYKLHVTESSTYGTGSVAYSINNYTYQGYGDVQISLLKPDGSDTGATPSYSGAPNSATLAYTVPAGASGNHTTGNYKVRVTESNTYGTGTVSYNLSGYTYQGYGDVQISLLKPDGSDTGAAPTYSGAPSAATLNYTVPSGATGNHTTGNYKLHVVELNTYGTGTTSYSINNYTYPGYADTRISLLKPDGSDTGAVPTYGGAPSSASLSYTVPSGASGDHTTGNYKLHVTELNTYGTGTTSYSINNYTYPGYADTRISLLKPDGSDTGATPTYSGAPNSATLTYTVPSGATGNHTTGNYRLHVTESSTYGTGTVSYSETGYTYQGYADLQMQLKDPSNNVVQTASLSGPSSSALSYTVPWNASGTYSLALSAPGTYGTGSTSYTMSYSYPHAMSEDYSYDFLGRLTDVVQHWDGTTRHYDFDKNSNRTTLSVNNAVAKNYTYNAFDRLTQVTDGANAVIETLGYANAGNTGEVATDTRNGVTTTYTYDAAGRPISESNSSGSNTWTLDGLNRVLRNTKKDGAGTAISDTRYGYDDTGDSRLYEADWSTGSIATTYFDGTDGLAAIKQGSTTTWSYYSGHGDTVQTANASGAPGAATPSVYDEFGVPAGTTPTPFGWTGKQQRDTSALTGVIRMGARLYDPTLGRFLSVDPVPGGSANDYDYVNQDPLNDVDLEGTLCWSCAFKHVAHAVTKTATFVGKAAARVGGGTARCAVHWMECADSLKRVIAVPVLIGMTVTQGVALALACGTVIGCLAAGPTLVLGIGAGALGTYKYTRSLWRNRRTLFHYE